MIKFIIIQTFKNDTQHLIKYNTESTSLTAARIKENLSDDTKNIWSSSIIRVELFERYSDDGGFILTATFENPHL